MTIAAFLALAGVVAAPAFAADGDVRPAVIAQSPQGRADTTAEVHSAGSPADPGVALADAADPLSSPEPSVEAPALARGVERLRPPTLDALREAPKVPEMRLPLAPPSHTDDERHRAPRPPIVPSGAEPADEPGRSLPLPVSSARTAEASGRRGSRSPRRTSPRSAARGDGGSGTTVAPRPARAVPEEGTREGDASRSGAGLPFAVLTAVLALVFTLARALEPAVVIIERIPPEAVAALLGLLVLAASLALVSLRERRRLRHARRRALVDSLTGVANRLAFEDRLTSEWERAVRHNRPLGVIVLDIDGLKLINDTLGHAAGDDLLQRVGAALAGRIRGSDMAARLGGDEFVVLTTETRAPGLATLANSLRDALGELPVEVSLGWAERGIRDVTAGDVLQRADAAMYRDKNRRRQAAAPPGAGAEAESGRRFSRGPREELVRPSPESPSE